jgi:8-oxo-dGTP pyrophosphatase MutT (NUDIX family)
MTFDRLCSLITENKTPIVFFGKRGAGVLIYCKKTRRFLLGKRAHNVQEPGTWGLFGGAINNDHETANQAAMRELEEEINYTGEVHLYTLDIYRNGSFSYHNFLGIVPEEFDADLDWENTQAKWFKLDEFPTPLHFGVARLIPKLKHKKLNESVKIISEAKIENLDLEKAYNLFYKEYTTATGKAWPREKFYAKAQNWDFYGDDQGFIAIRPQQSGFFKLVATAGNRKSQYKALLEIAPVLPLWGMVSADIRNLLIKRGFKEPNFIERQFLIKMLQTNKVVGGEITKFNTNGGVEMNLPDIGPTVKYFIGTDLYWKKLYSMKHLFPKNNK